MCILERTPRVSGLFAVPVDMPGWTTRDLARFGNFDRGAPWTYRATSVAAVTRSSDPQRVRSVLLSTVPFQVHRPPRPASGPDGRPVG